MKRAWGLVVIAGSILSAAGAAAENLYGGSSFAHVAADRRAERVGDMLTVVVFQSAEARNRAQNVSRQRRSFEGNVSGGNLDESGALSLDGAYSGEGEVRRSESFVTQISVVVEDVTTNGDFLITGQQSMRINGEHTMVRIRGRVRPQDISTDNSILSTQIAEAEISYDGRGFVSRNAEPNLIHRILSLLGLGG